MGGRRTTGPQTHNSAFGSPIQSSVLFPPSSILPWVWSEFGGDPCPARTPVMILFVQQSQTQNGPPLRFSLLASKPIPVRQDDAMDLESATACRPRHLPQVRESGPQALTGTGRYAIKYRWRRHGPGRKAAPGRVCCLFLAVWYGRRMRRPYGCLVRETPTLREASIKEEHHVAPRAGSPRRGRRLAPVLVG